MDKVSDFVFLAITFVVFVVVLYADFVFMPLGNYATQRLILTHSLGVFVVFSFGFLGWRHGWGLYAKLWPAWLISAFLLLNAVVFSNSRFSAVEPGMYTAFFLGFALLGFLSKSLGRTYYWVVIYCYVAVAMTALYGAVSIIIYLFSVIDGLASLSAGIPWGFTNVRYWSHVATWLIPIIPLAVLIGPFRDNMLWRSLVVFSSASWWWIILLSEARGSFVSVVFGVLLSAILIGRPAILWFRVSLFCLVIGILMWLLLSVVIPSLLIGEQLIPSISSSTSGRIPLFVEAWSMSLVNFPFGLGPQSWLTHDILRKEYFQSAKFGHPHNMYLMWAAEYGWLFICLLLLFVVQSIWLFCNRRIEVRDLNKPCEHAYLLAAFTAAVSAGLLHGGVSAVFMAPGSMLIGIFILGLFHALIIPEIVASPSSPSKNRFFFTFFVFLVVSAICIYWLVKIWEYHAAMTKDLDFYRDNIQAETFPRFWSHGNFPRHPDLMP
ncbi:O-antigen ligase [Marinobacter pelagius]|uniref:O-antigen ligase n=2 Tax=Marinobacter pelagius TaxID=379482 RepID=A0A366GJ10_9GAMM|nr:O-antigen ligase [Marinobacter pelagius]